MPKEYVRDAHAGSFVITAGQEFISDGPDPTFEVKIGWNKETGDVQIATIDRAREDSFERDGGLYVNLDRRGINDLIRHLRRARDQAFGRDE